MLRPPAPHGTQEAGRASNAKKRVPPAVSAIAFCPTKQRLFCGQRSGDLVFWPLSETGHGGFARCLPCCGPLRGAGRLRPALLCHSHVWVVIMRLHGSAGRVAACISLHAQPPLLPAQCPTAGTCRYVGSHRGPITCICVPPTHGLEASPLSQGGLVLSGSVGGEMKIWDYQGKVGPGVPWRSSHPCCRLLAPHAFGPGLLHGTCPQFMADLLPSFQPAKAPPSKEWPRCPPPPAPTAQVNLQPTVTVQTLHGHKGTITGIEVHGDHIMSSSTDGSVRVWRAVEGRGQLMYPWFDLQVGRGVAALLNAGVTIMSNDGCSYTHTLGDQAQVFTRAHHPAPHAPLLTAQAVVASMNGWARSLTYSRSNEVGDRGTFFVCDEEGSVVRIVPCGTKQDRGDM